MNNRYSLIMNPSFDEEFVGWVRSNEDDVTLYSDSYFGTGTCCHIHGLNAYVYQVFPHALGVDWFNGLAFYMMQDNTVLNGIKVKYWYSDDTTSEEIFKATKNMLWKRFALSPTTGKFIEALMFQKPSGYTANAFIDAIVAQTYSTVLTSLDHEYIFEEDDIPTTETTIKTILDSGIVEYLRFKVEAETNSHETVIKIYCDDVLVFHESFDSLNGFGYNASSHKINILKYTVDGECVLHVTLPFKFKNKLEITAEAFTTTVGLDTEGLVTLS